MIMHPQTNILPDQNFGVPGYENPFAPPSTDPLSPGQLPLDLFLRQNQINPDDDYEY